MNGLINRTPRGRMATENAYRHLGLENEVKMWYPFNENASQTGDGRSEWIQRIIHRF